MSNPNPSPATRFKPGQSGNPAGRPPEVSIKTEFRRMLREDENLRKTFFLDLFDKEKALIWQMLEGKPRQDLGVEGSFKNYVIRESGDDTSVALSESTSSMASADTAGVESESI